MFRPIVLVLLSCTLLLAACGGGDDGNGGEALSLEEYFASVDEIGMTVDAELNAIDETLNSADPQTDEEYLTLFHGAYQDGEEALETASRALDALTPPPEAADAHSSFLDTIENVRSLVSGLVDSIDGFTTRAELDAHFADIGPDLGQADADLTSACLALQSVADDNGITADLRCGD